MVILTKALEQYTNVEYEIHGQLNSSEPNSEVA